MVSAAEPGPEIHEYLIRRLADLGRRPRVTRHRLGCEGIMNLVGLRLGAAAPVAIAQRVGSDHARLAQSLAAMHLFGPGRLAAGGVGCCDTSTSAHGRSAATRGAEVFCLTGTEGIAHRSSGLGRRTSACCPQCGLPGTRHAAGLQTDACPSCKRCGSGDAAACSPPGHAPGARGEHPTRNACTGKTDGGTHCRPRSQLRRTGNKTGGNARNKNRQTKDGDRGQNDRSGMAQIDVA